MLTLSYYAPVVLWRCQGIGGMKREDVTQMGSQPPEQGGDIALASYPAPGVGGKDRGVAVLS